MSSTECATDAADAAQTADRLASAFRSIHRERMAGLPILHPELGVAVVDGRCWQGHWLGVLVTPWCMNLVLVPALGSTLAQAQAGSVEVLDFPAGAFEFTVSVLDGFGSIATCSLFSPMQRFADQPAAEAAAGAVMVGLFEPAAEQAAGGATAEERATRDCPPPASTSALRAPAPRAGLSRRDLLRGSFRGR